jgi:hypothetical protein
MKDDETQVLYGPKTLLEFPAKKENITGIICSMTALRKRTKRASQYSKLKDISATIKQCE